VPDELTLGNVRRIRHPGALGVAAGLFDGLAEEAAELVRAMRTAQLELAGAYDPERHDEVMARLDWQAFTEESCTASFRSSSWSPPSASGRVIDEMSALVRSDDLFAC
jgi:hypothetical protein